MDDNEILKQMLEVFSNYVHAQSLLLEKWHQLIFLTPRWWLAFIRHNPLDNLVKDP